MYSGTLVFSQVMDFMPIAALSPPRHPINISPSQISPAGIEGGDPAGHWVKNFTKFIYTPEDVTDLLQIGQKMKKIRNYFGDFNQEREDKPLHLFNSSSDLID